MGLSGIWSWMSATIDKYKLLKDMAKTQEEKDAYDKIISDLEEKQEEYK